MEHNPREIWFSQASTIIEALTQSGISTSDIAALGITNQRETTIVWDAETGSPVYNAIVWQDRRTADYCNELMEQGWKDRIREKTGLIPDAYFSATKIRWILNNVPGAREKAEAGKLRFGTVDTWLIWNLTKGQVHVTDVSNASRTMLYNIHTLQWDEELIELMTIPRSMLPEVHVSSEIYGHTCTSIASTPIPIAGLAGDQQDALFGQMCTEPGAVKNTYGTGCFLLMNTGKKAILSENNLLTTIAWKIGEEVCYAMQKDAGVQLTELKVDGGASRDNYMMQVQADLLGTTVIRPTIVETTAKGAAYLAGLAVGLWSGIDEIKQQWAVERTFVPTEDKERVEKLKAGWADAVGRSLSR